MGALLRAEGYGLQSNRKTKEGQDHPDRGSGRGVLLCDVVEADQVCGPRESQEGADDERHPG